MTNYTENSSYRKTFRNWTTKNNVPVPGAISINSDCPVSTPENPTFILGNTAWTQMSPQLEPQYPPELLYTICAHVYASCLLPDDPSLDPLIVTDHRAPTAHPSSIPAGYWPEPVARRTLASLCLVNHAWFEAAKPWLWHKYAMSSILKCVFLLKPRCRLEVRLPRTWLSLVEEIAWNYEEETVDSVMEKTMKAAANAAIQSSNVHSNKLDARLEESMFFDRIDFPDTTISMDLLSPVPSRNPSPRRLRPKSKSPARWKLLKSINDAIQDVMNSQANGVYGGFNLISSHRLFSSSANSSNTQGPSSRSFCPSPRFQPFPHHWYASIC